MNPSPTPRLVSLATATRGNDLDQEVVAAHAGELFAATHGGFDRLAPIFRNAAIDTRQGGRRVGERIRFAAPRLVHARDVLRAHGNRSAATVLFVLKATLDAGETGRQLLTTLSPGFTAGTLLMEIAC